MPKNMALSPEDASYVCEQFGIDVDRPLICQVSRFDPWKDPLGVIDAYRIVKQQLPDVQLALVGSMASDDPEGWDFFNATIAHADGDPDVHILNNFNNVGAIEVNAFQSHADVALQKSTREGFGLTVSRGDLEGAPVHRRQCRRHPAAGGGQRHRLSRGDRRAVRAALARAAADPALGKSLGRRGKEHVRSHFLTPRYLRDYLRIFTSPSRVMSGDPARASPLVLVSNRGPVTFGPDGEVQRGTGGLVTALTGLGLPPRRRLDRLGDERARRGGLPRARRPAVRRCARPAGGEYHGAPGRQRPRGL